MGIPDEEKINEEDQGEPVKLNNEIRQKKD